MDELRSGSLLELCCDRLDYGTSEMQLICLLSTFKPLGVIGTVKQVSPRGPEGTTGQLHSLLAAIALLATGTDWAAGFVSVDCRSVKTDRFIGRSLSSGEFAWWQSGRWGHQLLAESDKGGAIATAVATVAT